MSEKTPKITSNGLTGSEIVFALGRSSLGEVLVARGANGICAILLGDDPQRLIRDLGALFARDRLIGVGASPDAALSSAVQEAVHAAEQAVEAPWRKFDLPLDIRGTEFQRRVWRELREIPAGTTTSYTEIARRIGGPRLCARWRAPAPPMFWRSPFPVIACCAAMAPCPGIAGEWSASAS